jgi:hypothetical protein
MGRKVESVDRKPLRTGIQKSGVRTAEGKQTPEAESVDKVEINTGI